MASMKEDTPNRSNVKGGPRELTTTSYAILGLLSVRPWSAYELAGQMKRSLKRHWPRAESGVYDEPKNLIRHGLARATVEATGRRTRTVYSITPRGRRALKRWLAQPSAPPRFESEALVRSMFAEAGTKADLLATLREMREQAEGLRAEVLRQGAEYLSTGGPFPHRLHLIALNGRFLLDFSGLLRDWARWAEEEVVSWPDVAPLPDRSRGMAIFRGVLGDDLVGEILASEAGLRTLSADPTTNKERLGEP
jgi:PadR family transcriptional regulator AphA